MLALQVKIICQYQRKNINGKPTSRFLKYTTSSHCKIKRLKVITQKGRKEKLRDVTTSWKSEVMKKDQHEFYRIFHDLSSGVGFMLIYWAVIQLEPHNFAIFDSCYTIQETA